jgi:hypothetical protein
MPPELVAMFNGGIPQRGALEWLRFDVHIAIRVTARDLEASALQAHHEIASPDDVPGPRPGATLDSTERLLPDGHNLLREVGNADVAGYQDACSKVLDLERRGRDLGITRNLKVQREVSRAAE